jgi:hypothetical protein
MSSATYRCALCGRQETVVPDGRGFPPDIARRKLVRWCRANDCPSRPVYRAGLSPMLEALVRRAGREGGGGVAS